MASVRTIAVMSCYRPNSQFLTNVDLAAGQSDEVVVVDDGSGPGWAAILSELDSRSSVTVIPHPENLGIARTLNDGVELAVTHGATHIVFLDQDSALPDGFVSSLHELLAKASFAELPVGVAAPWRINDYESRKPGSVVKGFQLRDEPIQSGQLMPIATWHAVGRFREEFFIDGVDTDYFLRMQDAGLVAVFERTLNLPHSLGNAVEATLFGRVVRVGGRPLTVRVHAPQRTYYIYRNGVRLARERFGSNSRFAIGWMVGMLKRSVISIGLGPRKWEQFRATLTGTLDGLLGRSGKATRSFSTSSAGAAAEAE